MRGSRRGSCGTRDTLAGVRRRRARDGSDHTMKYKAAPVLDEEGKVAFWVGIDSDITEYKAIEQALRSANQELEATILGYDYVVIIPETSASRNF